MAKFGEFVMRKGIHPPLPDVEKIQVVEMDEPDAITMAEKRKEYRRIFNESRSVEPANLSLRDPNTPSLHIFS